MYPNATFNHLTALYSDHKPILINPSPPSSHRPRPFRFEAMWTQDATAAVVIENAWSKGHPHPNMAHLMTKLKITKLALKDWNWKVFCHLQTCIQSVWEYIDNLQSQPQTSTTIEMKHKSQKELDELLLKERILWMEKVKSRWLEEGDANTRFFHLSTVVHRKHNTIHSILDRDNNILESYDLIAQNFIDFYSNLFATVSPSFPFDFQGFIQP